MDHPSLPVPSAKIAAQWAEEVWKESEPIGADGAVPESFFVAFPTDIGALSNRIRALRSSAFWKRACSILIA
jgi:hypothetical protein